MSELHIGRAPRRITGFGSVWPRRHGPKPADGGTDARPVHWWVRYWHRGKERAEPAKPNTEAAAWRLLRQRNAEVLQGRLMAAPERVTFDDLAKMVTDDYTVNGCDLRRAGRALDRLRKTFGSTPAVDIAAGLDGYVAAQREGGAARATIKRDLSVLGKAFSLAVRAGRIPYRPKLPIIVVHNTRQGFFEDRDLLRVQEHLPEHLRPVVQFAALTGWRRGEVVALQWRQVDFKAGIVRLEPGTTKNREGRVFPFAADPQLRELLEQQLEATTALERQTGSIIPAVFHRRGRPLRDFYTGWRAACRRAGVPGRLFHDLRRTAVRNLERAGVPRSVAMKLTGHLTESVYRRYAIVNEADLADGVKRLAASRTRTIPVRFRRAAAAADEA